MIKASDVEAAAEVAPLVNRDRVKLARESLAWTQRQLTDELAALGHHVTPAAISQIETGAARPSPATLAAIAAATEFPVEFFLKRRGDGAAAGFFRSLRSTPARDRSRALAHAHILHDLVVALEKFVEFPPIDLPKVELNARQEEEIQDIARTVRRHWRLADGPIGNVVNEIERHGVVAARIPIGGANVDAFSVWFPDRPVVILGNDKNNYVRSRFDAAHELAHVLLHKPEQAGTKEAESEAHRFAAEFLMPARLIKGELPSTADWRRLAELKADWGVSMAALLYRAKDLGVMTQARYTSAMKYMSAKGWRKQEPGDGRPLLPQEWRPELGDRQDLTPEQPRLLRLAITSIRDDGYTVEAVAEEAALPLQLVERLVSATTAGRRRLQI